MRTFKDICKEVNKENTKFLRNGGDTASTSSLLDVAVKIYAAERSNRPHTVDVEPSTDIELQLSSLGDILKSYQDKQSNPKTIKFKELFIFGLNAGKNQKGTLKFINGEILIDPSSELLSFNYTSADTGEVRQAPSFLKSNIIGYSYTEIDKCSDTVAN